MLRIMARKVILQSLPTNIPDLEEPRPVCFLTKGTKITIGPTIDEPKLFPGFILQMEFLFFNVEIIHVFNSTFVAIRFATSHTFGFPSRRKWPPSDILKIFCNILKNKDKKVYSSDCAKNSHWKDLLNL